MSPVVLTRNIQELADAGSPVPTALLRSPDDADLLVEGGQVVGVALRTPDGPVPLQSTAHPERDAASWIDARVLQASTVVIVGAGAGHVIEALTRLGYGGRMLVLEPSPGACLATLTRRDWTSLIRSRRLRWLVGPTYDGWTDAWSWLTPGEAPGIVIHPVLGQMRPQDVRAALEIVKRLVFNAGANEAARRRFAGPYLVNTLQNLPHLLRSHDVAELENRFRGMPAVIAAAGPSLNRNLEQLAPVRERALLVAVDTALRPCLAAGLEPDLVVAVDPGALNLRHLSVDAAPARTWLVAEPSLAPGSFAAFGGRVLTYRVGAHEPWPWLQRNGVDRAVLRAWGSVLTTALDLSVRLGCDPIVLIGADFGYTNGQPYCRGTAYEEDWAREVAEYGSLEAVWEARWRVMATVEETGLDGRRVRTTPQLLAFRDWIGSYCAQQTVRIVNGTGAGLLQAVPTSSVADVLATHPEVDVDLPAAPPLPPPALVVEPYDPRGGGDWSRWADTTDESPLTLMRLIADAAAPPAGAAGRDAIAGFGKLAGEAPVERRAQALWQALHADRYYERHPRYRQPMSDIGLAMAQRLLDLQDDDVLLELGCGYGRLLWFLAPLVRKAIGYEIAHEPLALSGRYLAGRGHVELVHGTGDSLAPLPDASVNAVLAVCVLPFMARRAIAALLREVARVLAPGGRACLQFHHDGPRHLPRADDAPDEAARFADLRQPPAASHDEEEVRRLVEAAGLRVTEVVHESLEQYHPGYDMSWIWARVVKFPSADV